jgi:hypothetical protein
VRVSCATPSDEATDPTAPATATATRAAAPATATATHDDPAAATRAAITDAVTLLNTFLTR